MVCRVSCVYFIMYIFISNEYNMQSPRKGRTEGRAHGTGVHANNHFNVILYIKKIV